jgi:hypothetical protein
MSIMGTRAWHACIILIHTLLGWYTAIKELTATTSTILILWHLVWQSPPMHHIIILPWAHIEAVAGLFSTVGQCINRVMKQIFLLPSSLGECLLWGPSLLISPGGGRKGMAWWLWKGSVIAVQYSTPKKGHTAQAMWTRICKVHTGWLEVSLDGNFLVRAGEPGECQCLTANKNKNKWVKSCILTHLDMKAWRGREGPREGRREISERCKKHYDEQQGVPFGLQKRSR